MRNIFLQNILSLRVIIFPSGKKKKELEDKLSKSGK